MRQSSETTEFLGRLLETFSGAETDDTTRINTRLLVGVLGELVDRRRVWADPQTAFRSPSPVLRIDPPVAFRSPSDDPLDIAAARFKSALGIFAVTLRERHGGGTAPIDVALVKVVGQINALIDEVVRASHGELPQSATPAGDPQPGLSDQEEEAIDSSRGTGSAED